MMLTRSALRDSRLTGAWFLAAIGLGVGWLVAQPGASSASAQSGDEAIRWRYGQLVQRAGTEPQLTWRTLDREVRGTPRELMSSLHTAPRRQDATALDVLNALGAEGWELVSHTGIADGTQSWHFKRPVAP